jgi:hypothetical protein
MKEYAIQYYKNNGIDTTELNMKNYEVPQYM